MHLLAYWRLDNYLRDLDEGAGFNFNSRQARLHTAIQPGETLWLFTVVKNPPRFFVVAKLVVRSRTANPPGFKYGDYRVWGDLERSRYFRLRLEEPGDEAFELLRKLPLVSGSLADRSRLSLPQACQTIRGLTPDAHTLLEQFTRELPDEERAWQVANEYELERELLAGDTALEKILRRDHTGPSEDRRHRLLSLAGRDRQLVKEVHDRYSGRCQLCAFDSPVVYGTTSAESHHIVYLSRGGEDNLVNMVLLCPNHHTVVHKTEATFDYAQLTFCFPNGRVEPLCLNTHLTPRSFGDGACRRCAGADQHNRGRRPPAFGPAHRLASDPGSTVAGVGGSAASRGSSAQGVLLCGVRSALPPRRRRRQRTERLPRLAASRRIALVACRCTRLDPRSYGRAVPRAIPVFTWRPDVFSLS